MPPPIERLRFASFLIFLVFVFCFFVVFFVVQCSGPPTVSQLFAGCRSRCLDCPNNPRWLCDRLCPVRCYMYYVQYPSFWFCFHRYDKNLMTRSHIPKQAPVTHISGIEKQCWAFSSLCAYTSYAKSKGALNGKLKTVQCDDGTVEHQKSFEKYKTK